MGFLKSPPAVPVTRITKGGGSSILGNHAILKPSPGPFVAARPISSRKILDGERMPNGCFAAVIAACAGGTAACIRAFMTRESRPHPKEQEALPMKRWIAMLIVLLLSIMPAVAGSVEFTPYDYHVMYTANGKYIVYDFPDVMLYLPIEWEGAITVEQTDTGTAFFQTASYDKFMEDGLPKGGFLFKLRASEDESFRELPEYEYIGFSENANLYFYLSLPSDYEAYVYDPDIRAEYDGMHRQICRIAETAKISKSMHFYTEGMESTDAGMS